ncbi:MAG TPA: hypothetical protein VMA37_12560 [Acetobacteraceae bacterium]|nr:hypothetical protein [Acetobacteraceae bacterium]
MSGIVARPLPDLDALRSDVEHKVGHWPNPGRMADLDLSNGDNVAETERAFLKMENLDNPGLAAMVGGSA